MVNKIGKSCLVMVGIMDNLMVYSGKSWVMIANAILNAY